MTRVRLSINKIHEAQTVFRVVESRDRGIAESNFERVNFWSFVYITVISIVGLFQVSTLMKSEP